jgi:molecular chaperone GrpE
MTAETPDPGRVVDARPGTSPPDADADDGVVVEAELVDDGPEDDVAGDGGTADPVDVDEAVDAVEEAAEVVESDLEALALERDDYLDQLRRLQADFENYRKRVLKQQDELADRATERFVGELLPVLDACDAAAQHGDESAVPIAKALVDVLDKQGLEKLAPEGDGFDPNRHEAVAHEPGDGEPVVTEVLRPGYVWKGRVLRPAMVRVRG